MKINAPMLCLALLLGGPPAESSGEIVTKEVSFHGSDRISRQYVFQGGRNRQTRIRSGSWVARFPRHRPARSNAGVRHSFCVPFHGGFPVIYRPRVTSVWFYPGGCRTVVRVASPGFGR